MLMEGTEETCSTSIVALIKEHATKDGGEGSQGRPSGECRAATQKLPRGVYDHPSQTRRLCLVARALGNMGKRPHLPSIASHTPFTKTLSSTSHVLRVQPR